MSSDRNPVRAERAREPIRDRVLRLGCSTVGVAELLAVVLPHRGREPAEVRAAKLLAQHDGLLGIAGMGVSALRRGGLSAEAAARVVCAIELARRLSQESRRDRLELSTPEAVSAAIGPSMVGLAHEELWCLALDPRNRLTCEPLVVSKGDIDGTDCSPRAFFRLALKAGAATALAVHNHPSGDITPSAADRAATTRLVAAGRAVDVPLVDHVVMGHAGRFSSIRRLYPDCFR